MTLRKTLLAFLLMVLVAPVVQAQDTTFVQTLTFDSITTRRGTWKFPAETEQYRKVLMYYTLKCDAATTADQFPCGEWDYLTYTYVYDHTGVLDSNSNSHPFFLAGGQEVDTLYYSNSPVYDYHQHKQYFPVYDQVNSEDTSTVGAGTAMTAQTLAASAPLSKVQYLWTETELKAAGVDSGSIDKLQLDITQLGSTMKNLTIRAKATNETQLDDFESDGFTTVYRLNTTLNSTGWHTFDFMEAFVWDGKSNMVIEFSFEGTASGTDHQVHATTTVDPMGQTVQGADGFATFSNGSHIEVPMNGYDMGGEITISFWSYGDENALPRNTSILEAFNKNNQRVLNIHLPWGNNRIYWDAGGESGYDRIEKVAVEDDYEGEWIHWAFTKNASTGEMFIYRNGEVWHSGVDKDRLVGEIETLKIGRGVNGNPYEGKVDEFRVWRTALDQATIVDWMHRDATGHPSASDLVLYYQFDNGYNFANAGNGSFNDFAVGVPQVESFEAHELFRNYQSTLMRPNIKLLQGDYVLHLDSMIEVDSVMQKPLSLVRYAVDGNYIVSTGEEQVWNQGYSYTYDDNGEATDSTAITLGQQLNNYDLDYYEPPFEVIDRFEIARYITPYGINLSLGPQGFTWVFDVTDYAHLLHDSVDLSAGNNQELIDLQFVMIKGTPPRDVVQMDRIWGQSRSYSYRTMDNDENLSEVTLPLHPDAKTYRVKTRLTGHGHRSDNGNFPHCCEWKDNTHYLYVNGEEAGQWHIWETNDCALNPVYPQGGTWPGAREGWCPGDVVKDYEFEITDRVSGNEVSLDYDITPVPANNQGMGNGNYIVAMHFMQYGEPNHQLDAEVYDVIRPNNWEYYSRLNPACDDPIVTIRNSGAQTLTSLTFTYQVSNGPVRTREWKGNLEFMEKVDVVLPVDFMDFWVGDNEREFKVTVSNPNGGQDEYADNDTYTTRFDVPDFYEKNTLIFEIRTNNIPQDNHYVVKDQQGNVVLERNNFAATTTYRDTMNLPFGCYTMELVDEANDGLSYWAFPAAGSGFMRIMMLDGNFVSRVKTFEREFGRKITYAFSVGNAVSVGDDIPFDQAISVYPNPTAGNLTVELQGHRGDFDVEILNSVGQQIYKSKMSADRDFLLQEFDLSNHPAGIYFVTISDGVTQATRKVLLQPMQ